MADTSIKISLELADAAAQKALSDFISNGARAEKAFSKLGNTGKSTFDQITVGIGKSINAWDIFNGNLAANLALRAFDSLVGAVNSVLSSFKDMVKEASRSEASINSLNIALKNAGLFSASASKELQIYASNLQKTTVYSDDAVLSSQALLATLTNLSIDGIKAATTASADLAASLNIDLQTATEMIAKAVNGNTKSFRAYGIEIQKGTSDGERLTNVLNALATQQGAAAAKTKTYAGAQAQLTNNQGDLLENLGKIYTQNAAVILTTKTLTEAYIDAAEWVDKNRVFLGDLLKTLAITAGVIAVGAAAWFLYTTAAASAAVASVTLLAAGAGIPVVFAAIAVAAQAAWAAIFAPITLIIAGIVALGVAIYAVVKNWDAIKVATYEAAAATLDYAAIAAGVFSKDSAQKLRDEAAAWREKAKATKESADSTKVLTEEEKAQAAARELKLKEELENTRRIYAEKLAERKKYNDTLALTDQETAFSLQQIENEHLQKMAEIRGEFDAKNLEIRLAQQTQELESKQALETAALQITIDSELAKAQAIADSDERAKALTAAKYKSEVDLSKLQSKQLIEVAKKKADDEEKIEQARIQNRKDTFSTIATLQDSNNKALAFAGKAAAITQIAIDTPVAVGKALAAFPPPFNFVAAGLVGAAMAAQAAKVAGLSFQDGGIVPGNSFTGDKISANVNSGEMILNKSQQGKLFKQINDGASDGVSELLRINNELLGAIFGAVRSGQSIQINGRELIYVFKDEMSRGRSFA